MFQGHVAQITEAIDGTDRGRVAFVQAVLENLGEPSERKSIEKVLGRR